MRLINKFIKCVDQISLSVGFFVKWLLLLATILSAANAVSRKAFDLSSNSMLEAQWYLFAAVFLLGSAYCFSTNSHIRIDFINNKLSPKTKNIIDVIGISFILIPFCVFIILISWGFFANAYSSQEMSSNAGGLIRWPAYSLIPLGFSLLLLQSLAELAKRVLFLTNQGPDYLSDQEDNTLIPLSKNSEESTSIDEKKEGY